MEKSNLKEALAYAVELAGNEEKIIQSERGIEYYDGQKHRLTELDPIKYADPIQLYSLSSLVSYVTDDVDDINLAKVIIHVESPTKVKLFSELNVHRKREQLIVASPLLPRFEYGVYQDAEQFNVSLQSCFLAAEHRELLLEFTSKIRIENSADLEDNGVTQTTKIQTGAASMSLAKAPNPVTLRPYRTFLEVEQPESEFIYRLNAKGQNALFEADGGQWRQRAVVRIKEYIEKELDAFIENEDAKIDYIVLA